MTAFKRKRVEEVIDQNSRLSLKEITNVTNVELFFTSIQTIVAKSGFRLKVPQMKVFWRSSQKEKYNDIAYGHHRWHS